MGIPARAVMPRDKAKAKEFVAYGTPAEGCPDPVLRSINELRGQLEATLKRIEELEDRVGETEKPVRLTRPVAASGE